MKKKILLMKPINDIYYVVSPSLGLGYLASYLIKDGHDVDIIDSGKEKLTYDQFQYKIMEKKYDIIGFSMFTHEMNSVKEHSKIIKEYSKDSIIIVGGSQPSGDSYGTMDFLRDVDFGFSGECELALSEFASKDLADLKIEEVIVGIPNLIWRSETGIVVNNIKKIDNLNELLFPSWELINPKEYPISPHGTFTKNFPVAPIITSRGCPYQCTFCAGFTITGRRFRQRSVDNVMKEIEFLYNEYGVREFHIEDDNFTLKNDFVIKLCERIIGKELNISLACPNGIRLDTLTRELLQNMEQAGFYSVAVGIESGSNKILKSMKKFLDVDKIKEKIDLIKEHTNIKITGFFLIGSPGETEEDILDTIKFAKELDIDKASFAFTMPLPATEIWKGWRKEKNTTDYDSFFYYKIVPLSGISEERLIKLYKKAILSFYMRPKIIFGLLSEIKTFNQTKILCKRVLNIFAKTA